MEDYNTNISSFVNAYIDSLESEWRTKRNVWLQNSKYNPGNAKMKNSIYAHETFKDYMRSKSVQNIEMQVPFQLPEVPKMSENSNPVLKDDNTTIKPQPSSISQEEKGILKQSYSNSKKDNSEQDLEELYTWIDETPLSRPKKQIRRDFSDGVPVAEILHYYFPRLVELHNYVNANSAAQKRVNWDMLSRKVFVKLDLKLSQTTLDNIVNAKPGAIEGVLFDLRTKVLEISSSSNAQSSSSTVKRSSIRPRSVPIRKTEFFPTVNKVGVRVRSDGVSQTATPRDKLTQCVNTRRSRSFCGKTSVLKSRLPVAERKETVTVIDTDLAGNPQVIYKGHTMLSSTVLEDKEKRRQDLETIVNGLHKKVYFLDSLIQTKDDLAEDLTMQINALESKLQELEQCDGES